VPLPTETFARSQNAMVDLRPTTSASGIGSGGLASGGCYGLAFIIRLATTWRLSANNNTIGGST